MASPGSFRGSSLRSARSSQPSAGIRELRRDGRRRALTERTLVAVCVKRVRSLRAGSQPVMSSTAAQEFDRADACCDQIAFDQDSGHPPGCG